ncbi:hypothetical protein HanIR_Chr11g0514551 [Helianthus annuus]|nr:hypothetical protein HanIR_Chr11g0514551 [Helianthus annuus]
MGLISLLLSGVRNLLVYVADEFPVLPLAPSSVQKRPDSDLFKGRRLVMLLVLVLVLLSVSVSFEFILTSNRRLVSWFCIIGWWPPASEMDGGIDASIPVMV